MATVFHLERRAVEEGAGAGAGTAVVATIWLDRPEARNAMGRAFFAELPALIASVSSDPAVRVVVVAARGAHFSVGLDLQEMAGALAGGEGGRATATASPAARARDTRAWVLAWQAAISALADCPKPVVAAVHGYCLGAGMDLVTACDIRLASADAVFGVREVAMSIVADLGTLQRLPRIVGGGHATELALTGRDIGAARAMEIGLVSDVLPDRETLLAAAFDTARRIAALSPLAVQGTKAVLAANDGRTVAQGLDYVATWNAGMLASDDVAEAVRAFLEKRPPRFTGS